MDRKNFEVKCMTELKRIVRFCQPLGLLSPKSDPSMKITKPCMWQDFNERLSRLDLGPGVPAFRSIRHVVFLLYPGLTTAAALTDMHDARLAAVWAAELVEEKDRHRDAEAVAAE